MLDFLIAVIWQVHRSVKNKAEILAYEDRCSFNADGHSIKNAFLKNEDYAMTVVQTIDPSQREESSNWHGFVSTLKSFIRKQLGQQIHQTQEIVETLKTQIIETQKTQQTQTMQEMKRKINNLKEYIDKKE